MNTTPVSLLERVRNSTDQAAWEQFVALYLPLLWEWTRRLKLAESDAADVIQDVFVVLLRKLPDFKYLPNQSFRAWLWTILRNRAHDRYRRKRGIPWDSKYEVPISEEPVFDQREYQEFILARMLQVLKSEFPETVWRSFWEHMVRRRPAVEVAAEVGLAPGTVHVYKIRVIKVLRERLEGLWD